ncbi:MAG: hypothetical protein A7315_08750 [Candidatus Altiarchaeales archaeon WOR_SM1_79]|nr:MAG: hypothetical protein A7315_08750 [Candidatus Altiarchaeales archaeon WOR_SM1_79]
MDKKSKFKTLRWWENCKPPSEDENEELDYGALIKTHPWIVKKNAKCILSPDSDGLLCGLFMSHYLNWEVAGFYDGKILILKDGLKANNCVFLDMEIYRENIRSLGHHIVLFNKKRVPENWNNFRNCIQPNNIRGYDAYSTVILNNKKRKNFSLKYPLASIHFLLGIVGSVKDIEIKKSAICPLFYTDGTFKNLFNYPENCISWINFLGGDNEKNALHKIFYNEHYLVSDLMLALSDFFKKLSDIGKNADKINMSNTKGEPVNLIKERGNYSIVEDEKNKVERFLTMLSELTKWDYKVNKWNWKFKIFKFSKRNIKPSNARYDELMNNEPLSLAMTSGQAIEYTLEEPDKLP